MISIMETGSVFEVQKDLNDDLAEEDLRVEDLPQFLLDRSTLITKMFDESVMGPATERVDIIVYYVQMVFNLFVAKHAIRLNQTAGVVSATSDHAFVMYSGPHATDKSKAISYIQRLNTKRLKEFAQKVVDSYDITRHVHYRT